MRRAFRAGVVLAVAALLVALPVTTPVLLASDTGSTLHSGSAGTTTLVRSMGLESTVAISGLPALDPAGDALVIVAPSKGYGDSEIRQIHAFLHQGGRVLIADDGGVGERLLHQLGAGIVSDTVPLYTPAFSGEPHRVVTTSTGRLPGLPEEVVLTRPVLVTGGEPVLLAPELAWRDMNNNGRPDLDEPLTGGAVAATARVGAGTLIVLGDPRAVQSGGEVARAFLAATADGERRVVIDEAHRVHSDPLGANRVIAGDGGVIVATGMLMLSVVLVAGAALAPRVRPEKPRRRVTRFGAYGEDPALLREVLGELDTE